jgi:hypothetical protein
MHRTPRILALAVGLLTVGVAVVGHARELAGQATADESEIEELVGPIALYPDDLLAIVLPGSTFPLQIVEADRWLEQNEGNADARPEDSWDESVKALINYPEVVSMMSQDLQWTAALGEAVAADQTAVMDAVQSFRRKVEAAGNLQTDDKQTVTVDQEVVKIVQTEPDVIYVPQYEPTVVVVQQPVPVYPTYYPYAYPVYYYPYPPGYTFARAVFWGATVAWACDWHGGGIYNDINIDRDVNRDIDRDIDRDRDRNVQDRPTNIDRSESQRRSQEDRGSWRSNQDPSSVRQGRTSNPSGRTGEAAQRPSGQDARTRSGASGAPSAGNYRNADRASKTARSSPPSREAFSGQSSGRSARAQSSRGAASRSARSRGGRRR